MFTVIVPTYNQAHYLPACLSSLLSQTYSSWEAVVINDGSTDSTANIADSYAKKDSRIHVFHKENGGTASALNLGLAKAAGEWICWLSSDDLFEQDALESFNNAIRQNPELRFFHSEFSELNEASGEITPSHPNRHLSLPNHYGQVITFFQGNYVHGISIAIHKSVFTEVSGFKTDLLYAQDVDMWLRISARFPFGHINKRTCITRVHGTADTVGFPDAGPIDVARACLDFLNHNRFPALFPFMDLQREDHILAAIDMVFKAALNTDAHMYRGIGYLPALLERLCEWFKEECPERIRSRFSSQLTPLLSDMRRSLPTGIRVALDRLVSPLPAKTNYIFHDWCKTLVANYIECSLCGNPAGAAVIAQYIKRQRGEVAAGIERELAAAVECIRAAEKVGTFPESRHAHAWLDGLKGLEIGPSSHNPFGLDTRFVGIRDEIYEEEQLRVTGSAVSLDIEALADNIPLPDDSEDFILSSHVIEHCPDVISTLLEWFRIIRPGGGIYMITPLRDASPSDVGREITPWSHILEDFINQANERSEPEAGRFGHCHYHVFDLDTMRTIVSKIFGDRLQIVDYLEKDDKIGNGFTLVYRKTVAGNDAFSWGLWRSFTARRTHQQLNSPEQNGFVNIGMITYNRLEFTRQAIDALVNTSAGYGYSLTVIDNASSDGSREYLQNQKALGVIKNLVLLDENVGVAKASNLAWSLEPEAAYYLKLDNDIVIQKPGWLGMMVDVVMAIPEAGAAAYNFEPVSYPEYEVHGIWVRPKNGNLGGACVLIPRNIHQLLGFWCEDYGLYGEEDADYGYRIMQAGLFNVYMHDEQIGIHLPSGRAAVIDPLTLLSSGGGEEDWYKEYRVWKDMLRRRNVQSGLFPGNLEKYTQSGGAVYLESAFLKNREESTPSDPSATETTITRTVSIIIPVYNQAALTRKCLSALLSDLHVDAEIILIDNGSTDWTPEYLASMGSRIRVTSNSTNLGFARACNQGAAIATGRYLVFLNNDTVPQAGWLDALISPALEGKAEIVGARLLYPDGTIQHAGVVFDEQGPLHCFKRAPADTFEANQARYLQAVTAACMLLTAKLFQELGGFDEGYINGFEDIDLCLSAVQRGYRVFYQPESFLIHHEESSPGRKLHDEENYERFLRRWHGRWQVDYQPRKPQISVIIPVFNQLAYTRKCLEALFLTTLKWADLIEIIVVDNGSDDCAREYLKTLEPRIHVLSHKENIGFAKGCNSGAWVAQGRYLVFLNNDTEPCSGWIEALLSVFENYRNIGIVGSKLLFPDGTIQHAGVAIVRDPYSATELSPCHVGYQQPDSPEHNHIQEYQAVTAACCMMERSLFAQISGFDEGYWNGFEDVDLCFKVHKAGYRIVYQPASVVIHHESKSGSERKRAEIGNLNRLQERWVGKIAPEYVRVSPELVEQIVPNE